MRAVWYERKGAASEVLELGEMPQPTPGEGEVLVAIKASGINPSDTKGRGGARGNIAMPFPRIVPHQDGAGIIEAVGAGVSPGRIGERVWVYEAQQGRAFGTAAEFVCLPEDRVVPMPAGMSFHEGACLGVPALTAHRCVFADGPVADKTVLVTGGAGAVGFYAVQFAKHGGARVVATVSNDSQAAVARSAGADLVLNRHQDDIVGRTAEFTGAADERSTDRIVDVAFGANLADSVRMLRPNGIIAAYSSDLVPEPPLPFWPLTMLDAAVRFVLVYVMTAEAHREAIDYVGEAAGQGWLRHNIGHVLPMDSVVRAHDLVEAGGSGKVIVEWD